MKKFFVGLLISIVLGLTLHTAVAQQFDTTKEQEAVKLVVKNYENAWNRHDAKGPC